MDNDLGMGGYGIYVWSCYGLTFAVMALMGWRTRVQQKRVYRDIEVRLKALEDRE